MKIFLFIFVFAVSSYAQGIEGIEHVTNFPQNPSNGQYVCKNDSIFMWRKGDWRFIRKPYIVYEASSFGGGGTPIDTNKLHYEKFAGKQDLIPNITDSSKYLEGKDTISLSNRIDAAGGSDWTELKRTTDTTTGTFTFVNLGQLQFTMTASGMYEIDAKLFITRATAANGVTLALNLGGSSSVGLIASSPDNTTDGTDMIKTSQMTTNTDSLQLTGTTITGELPICVTGRVLCDGSNRLFTFRWHLEVASSAITIKRGSYLRYRKLY